MEKSHSDERLALPPRLDTNNKLVMVAVIIAVLLSVISIIVALVSVGKTAPTNINISNPANIGSSGSDGDDDDDTIWLLAFQDAALNVDYIDDATGELKGFNIDVTNAVCKLANKNCRTLYDTKQRCWDSQAGTRAHAGEGIMAGYYDACVGWSHTYDRQRTLRFSDAIISQGPRGAFITLAENAGSFDWLNLTGKIIGFKDGSVIDEHCVARVDRIQGKDLSSDQIRHYVDNKALKEAFNDGEIDAAFILTLSIGADYSVVSDGISDCAISGLSLMTRKDNRLVDWWNPAFEQLKSSSQWPDICNDLTEEHGHLGGLNAAVCVM